MFTLDHTSGTIVDATKKGNTTRWVNHSCEPNCATRCVVLDGKRRVVLYSSRNVEAGEELTYDYQFAPDAPENEVPCACGAPTSRYRKAVDPPVTEKKSVGDEDGDEEDPSDERRETRRESRRECTPRTSEKLVRELTLVVVVVPEPFDRLLHLSSSARPSLFPPRPPFFASALPLPREPLSQRIFLGPGGTVEIFTVLSRPRSRARRNRSPHPEPRLFNRVIALRDVPRASARRADNDTADPSFQNPQAGVRKTRARRAPGQRERRSCTMRSNSLEASA